MPFLTDDELDVEVPGPPSGDGFRTDSGNSPNTPTAPPPSAVSVNLNDFASEQFPDLTGRDRAEVTTFVANLQIEKLIWINVQIGQRSRAFKDWFVQHLDFVTALRDKLPARGPNTVQVDGVAYTWAEFCLKFFGVSADWVRKLIATYSGMNADPNAAKRRREKTTPTPPESTVESALDPFVHEDESDVEDEPALLDHNGLVDVLDSELGWALDACFKRFITMPISFAHELENTAKKIAARYGVKLLISVEPEE